MPGSRQLVIRCRCVPSLAKYAFDWARGTTNYTVAAFATAGLPVFVTAAGGNAQLDLSAVAPQSLQDAVAAGVQPRLQVHMVDGLGALYMGVVPEQALVVSINPANKTQLGLKVVIAPDWQASVFFGNEVYSGGPIVDKVGAAILGAVDELGPSRASGLYDAAVLWRDTLGVSNITGAALTTLDDDLATPLVARCITNLPAPATAADMTHIRIGGLGAAQLDDVQAIDTTVFGPELLRAGRVLVTD